jgi:hypothetical protein
MCAFPYPGCPALRCSHHRDTVNACCWLPDGRRFLSAGLKLVILADVEGRELMRWRRQLPVQDMALTPDGAYVVLACGHQVQVVR